MKEKESGWLGQRGMEIPDQPDEPVRMPRLPAWVVAPVVLAGLYWCMAFYGSWGLCTTFDEIGHISIGYVINTTGDYRLEPMAGTLAQRWFGLPLWFSGPHLPSLDQPAWIKQNMLDFDYQFFYEAGNNPDSLLMQARAMACLIGAAVGVVVFFWSRRWFGGVGAGLAAGVCVFNPNMLALGGLATTDMAATLMFLLALAAAWRLLHRVSRLNVLIAAAAITATFLTKLSSLVLVPVILILLGVRILRGQPLPVAWPVNREVKGRLRQLAVLGGAWLAVGVLFWAGIWAGYGFRFSLYADPRPETGETMLLPWSYVLQGLGRGVPIMEFVRNHHLLPEPILYGFSFMTTAQGRGGWMNGHFSPDGFRSYFPYATLVKNPIPLFVLLVLSAAGVMMTWWKQTPPEARGGWGWFGLRLREGAYRFAPLWVLLGVYSVVAINTPLNIGVRHVLPLHPVLFIFTAGAAVWLERRYAGMAFLVLGCVLWYAVESVGASPRYLQYFNQLAGGSANGYKHLVDSNLDWGQDLPALSRWIGEHRNGPGEKPVYLIYGGYGDPRRYVPNVNFIYGHGAWEVRPNFQVDSLRGGTYCVGATMWAGYGEWTDAREKQYQELLKIVEALRQAKRSEAALKELMGQRPQMFWSQVLVTFSQLQSERLCEYLRKRTPDTVINHSILVFNLSDEDVQKAMTALAN